MFGPLSPSVPSFCLTHYKLGSVIHSGNQTVLITLTDYDETREEEQNVHQVWTGETHMYRQLQPNPNWRCESTTEWDFRTEATAKPINQQYIGGAEKHIKYSFHSLSL